VAYRGRQIFALRCFATPKRYKRKSRRAFTIRLVELPFPNRTNFGLKNLHFFTDEQTSRSFRGRVLQSFIDVLFKYRDGVFLKRRRRVYKLATLRARNQGGEFAS
jgi:hypothetical protein